MRSRGPHPLGHGPQPVRNWAAQKVLRARYQAKLHLYLHLLPIAHIPWSVEKWSSKKQVPGGKKVGDHWYRDKKLQNRESHLSCWRFIGTWWTDLQGQLQDKGFLHQEVCNNHPHHQSFHCTGNLNSNSGKMALWTPGLHLLGLPAFQIRSLFLAPTTHCSSYWPFECSNSYTIAFIVMQQAVQAWTQLQSLYCLTQETEAYHLEKFNYFWNMTEMLILRKWAF